MKFKPPPRYEPKGEETFGKPLKRGERAKEVINNVFGEQAALKQMKKYAGLRDKLDQEEQKKEEDKRYRWDRGDFKKFELAKNPELWSEVHKNYFNP